MASPYPPNPAFLRVKATLGADLRRIALKRDGLTYAIFASALRSIFPSAFPAVAISYTDGDGDQITIASDLELADVLIAYPDLLRITLVPTGAPCAPCAPCSPVHLPPSPATRAARRPAPKRAAPAARNAAPAKKKARAPPVTPREAAEAVPTPPAASASQKAGDAPAAVTQVPAGTLVCGGTPADAPGGDVTVEAAVAGDAGDDVDGLDGAKDGLTAPRVGGKDGADGESSAVADSCSGAPADAAGVPAKEAAAATQESTVVMAQKNAVAAAQESAAVAVVQDGLSPASLPESGVSVPAASAVVLSASPAPGSSLPACSVGSSLSPSATAAEGIAAIKFSLRKVCGSCKVLVDALLDFQRSGLFVCKKCYQRKYQKGRKKGGELTAAAAAAAAAAVACKTSTSKKACGTCGSVAEVHFKKKGVDVCCKCYDSVRRKRVS